jgi:hypothetical protein
MDNGYLVILIAAALLVGFVLFRVIDRAGSRSGITDPRDQAIRPDPFIPWGRWAPGQSLTHRSDILTGARGRRHVPRRVKPRGERDSTLGG